MELDSWQCQGFGDNQLSPQIAVFTTFMHDHQNYYKNDLEQYFADKANIYRFQKPNDFLIAGSQVAPIIARYDYRLLQQIIVPKLASVKNWKLKMLGEHNLYNASLAAVVGKVFGISDRVIKKAITDFPGLSGRLELVKEIKGVKYYNDTTATSPQALFSAVKALAKYKGKIILLGGGTDANLDLAGYVKNIAPSVKKLSCLKVRPLIK
jgi:UDP-N-acetylmuramoylalanine--D-glutamate ligase